MKTLEEILNEIMMREAHFFREMFIEDPLFLELEDVFKAYYKEPYIFGSIVLGIHEKEINNFLHRLQMAMNHLYNLQQRMEDEGIEVNELNELHTRASNIITSFTRNKDKIIYPFRFRDNGIGISS